MSQAASQPRPDQRDMNYMWPLLKHKESSFMVKIAKILGKTKGQCHDGHLNFYFFAGDKMKV